jgi:hypothetical protein
MYRFSADGFSILGLLTLFSPIWRINMANQPCTHEYLAKSQHGKVLICRDCGVVHLNLQNMSLRFDVEQFADLASLMTEASKRLSSSTKGSPCKRPTLTVVH